MYKIEITADTLTELAGKAMSLAVKLNSGTATEPAVYVPPAEPVEINPVAPTPPVSITPAKTEEVMPEPPAPAAPALNFDTDVAPVVLRAVATKGKPFVEAAMAEFGVERASQLDAARWAELIDRLESPF
jgi:hypothetical protein